MTRSIAIATGMSYRQAYDLVNEYGLRHGQRYAARVGPPHDASHEVMTEGLGWRWEPLRNATLAPGDLPDEPRLIAWSSNHLCAVIDGVVRDTFDPCRRGGGRTRIQGCSCLSAESQAVTAVVAQPVVPVVTAEHPIVDSPVMTIP